jgi:hypothetical protein
MPKRNKTSKKNAGIMGKKKVRSKKLKNLRFKDHLLNGKYYDYRVNNYAGRNRAAWSMNNRATY